MKRFILMSFLFFLTLPVVNAQETVKNRKERRAERQEKKMQEVKKMVLDKSFVFVPTHATPLGGGSIQLSHTFEAEIKGDSILSYLPFYGVAYHVEYGSRNSPFDFSLPIQNYEMSEDKNGFRVDFEVKNKMDMISFSFHISSLGYSTLSLTSTNRQAISYYGQLEQPDSDEEKK